MAANKEMPEALTSIPGLCKELNNRLTEEQKDSDYYAMLMRRFRDSPYPDLAIQFWHVSLEEAGHRDTIKKVIDMICPRERPPGAETSHEYAPPSYLVHEGPAPVPPTLFEVDFDKMYEEEGRNYDLLHDRVQNMALALSQNPRNYAYNSQELWLKYDRWRKDKERK